MRVTRCSQDFQISHTAAHGAHRTFPASTKTLRIFKQLRLVPCFLFQKFGWGSFAIFYEGGGWVAHPEEPDWCFVFLLYLFLPQSVHHSGSACVVVRGKRAASLSTGRASFSIRPALHPTIS